MPRKNLPPYVQVRWKGKKPNRTLRGYRAWWMRGAKRCFGPLRKTADEAHRDALDRRGERDPSAWGGAFGKRAEDWLDAIKVRNAADTIAFYRSKLANVYRTIPQSMPVEQITAAVVREFVRDALHRDKLSALTVQHCRRTLNCFFRWAMRRDIVRENPIPNVEWPKPENSSPDVFSAAELGALVARIADPWAHALALFVFYTGLRRAEVARLKVSDVADDVVWVRGKARAQSQPIPVEASAARETLLTVAKDREFVISGSTERTRRDKVAETFRHWQRKLAEPRWHPHALRHTAATIMLRNGVSPATVQRFLRHSSYAMTQRYVHMVESDVRSAAAFLRIETH